MINETIKKLVTYGIANSLSHKLDKLYITSKLAEILNINNYEEPEEDFDQIDIGEVIEEIFEYAISNLIIQNTQEQKDLLEARIMDCLLPKPHEVIDNFKKMHRISPKRATAWFYKFTKDSNYIKQSRAKNNLHWNTSTKYGRLDLCVDTTSEIITDAENKVKPLYPKCEACAENEGFKNNSHLRCIPITLNKEDWVFKYSPEAYYNEQFTAANTKHINMYIDGNTFTKLFEFLNIFPHYFVGAECELPFANEKGLPHEQFSGGNFEPAINRMEIEKYYKLKRFEDVQFGILNYPVSVLRLRYKDYTKIVKAATHILNQWKTYRDDSIGLIDSFDNNAKNTIVPVARKVGDIYELDLILRNNHLTPQYPNGIFGTHPQYLFVKDKPLKMIDLLGMAILPAQIDRDLKIIANKILNCEDLRSDEITKKYAEWVENFIIEYDDISEDNIMEILQDEIGKVYLKILENNGIFKRDENGQKAFEKFINTL